MFLFYRYQHLLLFSQFHIAGQLYISLTHLSASLSFSSRGSSNSQADFTASDAGCIIASQLHFFHLLEISSSEGFFHRPSLRRRHRRRASEGTTEFAHFIATAESFYFSHSQPSFSLQREQDEISSYHIFQTFSADCIRITISRAFAFRVSLLRFSAAALYFHLEGFIFFIVFSPFRL